MAADLNSVTIVGRLTRDAEQRVWGEQTIQSLRLAFSTRAKQRDGQWGDASNYIDVTIFGRDGLAQYLTKGTRIGVSGRLSWREWQDKDGGKRQSIEVIAQDVQLLDGRQEQQQVGGGSSHQQDDIPFSPSR